MATTIKAILTDTGEFSLEVFANAPYGREGRSVTVTLDDFTETMREHIKAVLHAALAVHSEEAQAQANLAAEEAAEVAGLFDRETNETFMIKGELYLREFGPQEVTQRGSHRVARRRRQ